MHLPFLASNRLYLACQHTNARFYRILFARTRIEWKNFSLMAHGITLISNRLAVEFHLLTFLSPVDMENHAEGEITAIAGQRRSGRRGHNGKRDSCKQQWAANVIPRSASGMKSPCHTHSIRCSATLSATGFKTLLPSGAASHQLNGGFLRLSPFAAVPFEMKSADSTQPNSWEL